MKLTATTKTNNIQLTGYPTLLQAGEVTAEYKARFIKAGYVRYDDDTDTSIYIEPEAIRSAVDDGLFKNKSVFVDHPKFWENHSMKVLVGIITNATYNEDEQAAEGTISFYVTQPPEAPKEDQTLIIVNQPNEADQIVQKIDVILADRASGKANADVGCSLTFYPQWAPRDNEDDPLRIVKLRFIKTVDIVFMPGSRGSNFLQKLTTLDIQNQTAVIGPPEVNLMLVTQTPNTTTAVPEQQKQPIMLEAQPAAVAPATTPATQPAAEVSDITAWQTAVRQQFANTIIDAATDLLPEQRLDLKARNWDSPATIQAAIEAQRAILAKARAGSAVTLGNIPPRGGAIVMGMTGLDELKVAFNALIEGQPHKGKFHPFSGIREAYMQVTGDYELHGRFRSDRVQLAAVTSTTMAELVADVLNKVIVNNLKMFDKWWLPGVTQRNFSSLKSVKWIKVSGIGELPTVSEGQSYTELKWDSDQETSLFVKKGGYLGLTLEAIDMDDTDFLSNAGPALARAAWLTLGKTIANIFVTNAVLNDGIALFHASHGNTATLALSDANLETVQIAMQKQTEPQPTGGQTQERLGGILYPELIWTCIDVEKTALRVLSSVPKSGTTNTGDENPDAMGNEREARMASARKRVIKVPFWTSTTQWIAQANPQMWPSIGLGFRFGEEPELFSVADENSGLVFSNDVFPVKVRWFFATGPIDYRGLYRGNV